MDLARGVGFSVETAGANSPEVTVGSGRCGVGREVVGVVVVVEVPVGRGLAAGADGAAATDEPGQEDGEDYEETRDADDDADYGAGVG